jgi:hypothetical protein
MSRRRRSAIRILQRKWPEFPRVWASLLARPGLHLGMAAALKTQDKALLREIDDLYANAGGDI